MSRSLLLRWEDLRRVSVGSSWLGHFSSSRASIPLVRTGHLDFRITQVKCLATSPPNPKRNFLSQLIGNIKDDLARNKEMKESLKKFRAEAEKLEQSDALQKARQKFHSVESETVKSSTVLKQKLETLKDRLQETLEEAQKTDIAKKAGQFTEGITKSAKEAAESVSERSQQLGKNTAFRTISQGVKAVKQEIDDSTLSKARAYKPPVKLRKRIEREYSVEAAKPVAPDKETTGVELHKDSKWFQSWETFKDNNPYVNKLFDWKAKYDESDNPVVRAGRVVTDKVSDLIGGMFQKTELSEVLTEICKVDPGFDKERFLRECELEIIPNILEAMIRGELEILKDWCHEAPYNALAAPIKQALTLGYKYDSTILDVANVDLAMGKMMEQGPVLIISFQTQQIMVVRNQKGDVVEGDPNKILRMHYVWVLCRDQNELSPTAAWKLMDMSANSAEQWL